MIAKIREVELEGLKRLAFGRSIDMSLGYIIGFLSALIIYILAANINGNLTFALIFTTLEMMSSMWARIIGWIKGVNFYYELKVILGRFASVFNLESKSMI